MGFAHLEHEALRPVAGEGLDVLVGGEDTCELVAPLPSWESFEDSVDLCQVEQPLHLCLVDGARQLLLGEHVGEVDEGAGQAGDRDVGR